MNRMALAQWVDDALAASGVSKSEIAREFLRRGFIGTEDRSVAGKIIAGKRDLSAEEMFAISEVTGYPIPSPANQLAAAIQSLPVVAQQRVADYVAVLTTLHESGKEIGPPPTIAPVDVPRLPSPDDDKRH